MFFNGIPSLRSLKSYVELHQNIANLHVTEAQPIERIIPGNSQPLRHKLSRPAKLLADASNQIIELEDQWIH